MMTQQTQSSQKLVALILLIICSALSVNANIINVVADGTIACGSIIGATGPPWDPLDNFIHIPNTVNHVTFTGCDWDYANVIFQIDNRRIVRNEPSDTRLRIELINCNFAPAGGTWIDGTYTDFVTDVDYVGATVEFSNVRKDAMSIMGGPNTFVADTTIDISGASYSIQGWGNFASIVADTVQRAKITVMLGIQYRHVCADHDVTDVMMASMRVNHVNCVEIRLTHNNQLIFQRGYTYTGTEMVRAVIAGVVAYDGAQIDGNSVAIYLSNSGVPISAETGAVDLNTHQGLSVIGGIAALARTPTEIARVKVSNIKIVAYGKMTFVSAIKATAHTIFGVVAVGTAGAEVIAPGLAIEGQFWAGGGVSNFDIQHTVDGSAAALFGVAAAAKDGSAQIYAPNSRIFVGGPTTNTLNLNIHDYNVGDITAVSIGGMSVHSRSASGSVNNRVIADDSTFSIYGSIGKLANRRNSDDFVSCSHNPAVAYFGIVCANMGDTATTSCDVQANRVTISIGQPSAGPPNSIITSNSYVNGAGAITFGGVISYSFMANPTATGNSRVTADDIKITATGIASVTMTTADPNTAAAVLGVLSTTKSTQPQNTLRASNALITVAENYVIVVQEPGTLTGYNTAIMGFACGAEGSSVTSCTMTLPSTKIHVDGTLYWHDINTMTGGGQRVAALAGIACRAVTTSTTFTSACDINADNVEIIVDGDFRPKAQNTGGRGSIGNNGITSLAIGAHNSRSTIEANNARIFARSTATSGPSPFSNLVGPPTGQSAGASGGISSLAVGGTGTQLSRVRAAGLQISSSTPHLFVNSPNQPETAAAAAGVAVLAVGDAAQAEVDTSDAFIIGEGSAAQMIAAHVDMSDMSYTQVNCAGATFGVAVMALANAGGSADTIVLSPRAKLAVYDHVHSRLIMHGADSVAASLAISGSSMQKAGAAATLTMNVDALGAVIESITTANNTVLLADTAGLATGTFAAAGIAAQGGTVTFDATGRTLRVCGAGIPGPMPGQTVMNGTVPASTGTDNSWVPTGPTHCPAATLSMPTTTAFPSTTYVTFDTSKIFPGTYFCDATPTHSHSLSDSYSISVSDSKSLSKLLSASSSLSVPHSASMSSSGSLSSSVSGSASPSASTSNSASTSGSTSHSASTSTPYSVSSSPADTVTPSTSFTGTVSGSRSPLGSAKPASTSLAQGLSATDGQPRTRTNTNSSSTGNLVLSHTVVGAATAPRAQTPTSTVSSSLRPTSSESSMLSATLDTATHLIRSSKLVGSMSASTTPSTSTSRAVNAPSSVTLRSPPLMTLTSTTPLTTSGSSMISSSTSATEGLRASATRSVSCDMPQLVVTPESVRSIDFRESPRLSINISSYPSILSGERIAADRFSPSSLQIGSGEAESPWFSPRLEEHSVFLSKDGGSVVFDVSVHQDSMRVYEEATIVITVPLQVFRCVPGGPQVAISVSVRVIPVPRPIPAAFVRSVESVGITTSAISSAIGTPTIAVQQSRIAAVVSLASCQFSHNEPVHAFQSPLGWRIGESQGSYYRGALVGNAVISLYVLVASSFCTLLVYDPSPAKQQGLIQSMRLLHLPGLWVVPIALLCQGTVSVATSLYNHGTHPLDKHLCWSAAMIVIVQWAAVMYLVTFGFKCESTTRQSVDDPTLSRLRRWLVWVLFSSTKWRDKKNRASKHRGFKQHWQSLFIDYREGYQWFFGVEMSFAILIGILDGVKKPSMCKSVVWTFLATVVLHTAAAVFLRPCAAPFNTFFHIIISVGTLFAVGFGALVQTVDDPQSASYQQLLGASQFCAMIVSGISVFKLGFDVLMLLRWLHSHYLRRQRMRLARMNIPLLSIEGYKEKVADATGSQPTTTMMDMVLDMWESTAAAYRRCRGQIHGVFSCGRNRKSFSEAVEEYDEDLEELLIVASLPASQTMAKETCIA